MEIKKLNYLLQDIYLKEHKTFYKFYNKYSKVINALAINNDKYIIDKVLYSKDDLVQEFWVKILEDLSIHQYLFYNKEQFDIYLESIMMEALSTINS